MAFLCQNCSTEQSTWSGSCCSCGSSLVLQVGREDPLVGRMVAGKYKILRKLGEGGMGSVYEGELQGIGQRVALKFLNRTFDADSKTALRFLNEARGLARLSHPNTVTLHDFGQDEEGRFFLSMEFVEGMDLHKLLEQRRRLSPQEAVSIILQVADALGDAHSKGLVHRDVKPENIMVRPRARGLFVKVLDFGLARLMDDKGSRLTNAGTLMGSLRYISPEQASGLAVDSRTDLYSLGIVLFELLTGEQPFSGGNEIDVLSKHKEAPMPHLWEALPVLRYTHLDAVIQQATAKVADERYATMELFSSALAEALEAEGRQAGAPTWPALELNADMMSPSPSSQAGSRSAPSSLAGDRTADSKSAARPPSGSTPRAGSVSRRPGSFSVNDRSNSVAAKASVVMVNTTALEPADPELEEFSRLSRTAFKPRTVAFAAGAVVLIAGAVIWTLSTPGRRPPERQEPQPIVAKPAAAPAPPPPSEPPPPPPDHPAPAVAGPAPEPSPAVNSAPTARAASDSPEQPAPIVKDPPPVRARKRRPPKVSPELANPFGP